MSTQVPPTSSPLDAVRHVADRYPHDPITRVAVLTELLHDLDDAQAVVREQRRTAIREALNAGATVKAIASILDCTTSRVYAIIG